MAASSVFSEARELSSHSQYITREDFKKRSVDDKLVIVFDEIRSTRNEQDSGFGKFEKSVTRVEEKLTKVIEATNAQNELLKTLAYKSIDLEARSRRNNVIFRGFYEYQGENCFHIVRNFLADQLNLDPNVYISRAHRLGPRHHTATKPRPIIVNFRDYCDAEEIMSRAYMLKNTSYSVDFDLPKEIQMARNELWPKLRHCQKYNPRVNVKIVYPAKLLVNGRLAEDALPEWDQYVHNDRLDIPDLTNLSTANNVDPVSTANSDVRTGSSLFARRDESSVGDQGNQRHESDGNVDRSIRSRASSTVSVSSGGESEHLDNSQTAVKSVDTPPSTPSTETVAKKKSHLPRSTKKSGRRKSSISPHKKQQRRNSTKTDTTNIRAQINSVRHRGKSSDVIFDTDTGLDDVTFRLNHSDDRQGDSDKQ